LAGNRKSTKIQQKVPKTPMAALHCANAALAGIPVATKAPDFILLLK